jgi:hypothetical protein
MKTETQDTCVPTPAQKSTSTLSPVETNFALALVVTGLAVIALGIFDDATAQSSPGAIIFYNEGPITNQANAIMTYLEGSFGALIMASSGVAAILCAVFRKWKAAGVLLLVAAATFILRALISTFFNDVGIQQ